MAAIVFRNNKYNVVYSVKDEDGKRKQKWESFKTEAEAKKRKAEIEFQKDTAKLTIPNCSNLNELLDEYVDLYGKTKWSITAFRNNTGLIDHYISPLIGHMKLNEITPRVLEKYYKTLQVTPATRRATDSRYTKKIRYVQKPTIQKIHKLLNSVFHQAMKWELMDKNPAMLAEVPTYEATKRDIWDASILMQVNEICDDDLLKLCINLAFACSLRIGELLGLTWDCVDISDESIKNGTAFIFINKELQRVNLKAYKAVDGKGVITTFPMTDGKNKTVLVLKTPKTPTSNRKIFLPRTVALMLKEWKALQDNAHEALGSEYADYNLVITSALGTPIEAAKIQKRFNKLIQENDLPRVVFHSLRHSSITYKLKLTRGDIKAVQGDSGHAQAKMVTDQYSHIIDENRKDNAKLFENAFYRGQGEEVEEIPADNAKVTEPVADPKVIDELLKNPEVVNLLLKLSKVVK